MKERIKRKSNLIFYNLPEGGNIDNDDNNSDAKVVNNIIKFLLPENSLKIHSLFRLGNYQQMSPRVRPLRAILTDELSVRQVITAFKAVKVNRAQLPSFIHKDMHMSWDKTLIQSHLFKEVQTKMKERVLKGETGLRIVYRRGEPTIIQTKTQNSPTLAGNLARG